MRILALGDIHGCAIAFDALLEVVELRPDDTLITLGDYVDRGPDSRRVIEHLMELHQTHHLVPLMGNHEQMMLEARDSKNMRKMWLGFGGDATVASYGGLEAVPWSHWHFLEKKCLMLWETETHFFVHAGSHPDRPLSDQPENCLLWDRFETAIPHESGKIMVCGHTSQKEGLPNNRGFAICIDTWACGSGWLTCLDVNERYIWQANKYGQTREFSLDELP